MLFGFATDAVLSLTADATLKICFVEFANHFASSK